PAVLVSKKNDALIANLTAERLVLNIFRRTGDVPSILGKHAISLPDALGPKQLVVSVRPKQPSTVRTCPFAASTNAWLDQTRWPIMNTKYIELNGSCIQLPMPDTAAYECRKVMLPTRPLKACAHARERRGTREIGSAAAIRQ